MCRIEYHSIPVVLRNEIEEKIKKEKLAITVLNEKGKEEKRYIQIEIKAENKRDGDRYITVGACKYQQYVFRYIDRVISNANVSREEKIKIWCEGHLPIRKITVGPSYDSEELRESIAHRVKNIYWMKYVDVDTSEIPYRSPIK